MPTIWDLDRIETLEDRGGERLGGSGDGGGGGESAGGSTIGTPGAVVVDVNTIRPLEEQPPETPVAVPTQDALTQERRRRGFVDAKRTKKPVTSGLKL